MRGRWLLFREIAFITHPTVHPRKQVAAVLSAAVTSTNSQGIALTSQAEPPMQKSLPQSPATLRERGSGGEALLLEKRPLPQNLRRPSHPSICVLQTVATVMVAAPMARSWAAQADAVEPVVRTSSIRRICSP